MYIPEKTCQPKAKQRQNAMEMAKSKGKTGSKHTKRKRRGNNRGNTTHNLAKRKIGVELTLRKAKRITVCRIVRCSLFVCLFSPLKAAERRKQSEEIKKAKSAPPINRLFICTIIIIIYGQEQVGKKYRKYKKYRKTTTQNG